MLGRKIKIFVHLVDFRDSREIADEITDYLISSNILDVAEVFFYCNYRIKNYDWLKEKFKNYDKIHFINLNTQPLDFEVPTLSDLRKRCAKWKRRYYILYIHHKGASKPDNLAVDDWRRLMCHFNITKWKDCFNKLKKGYDTAGVNWIDTGNKHFSGNFWWARSEYIEKLPQLKIPHEINYKSQLNIKDTDCYRMEAEYWIGLKDPKSFSFHNSDVANHYFDRYPKERYIDGCQTDHSLL
jgi:hypothetical protein